MFQIKVKKNIILDNLPWRCCCCCVCIQQSMSSNNDDDDGKYQIFTDRNDDDRDLNNNNKTIKIPFYFVSNSMFINSIIFEFGQIMKWNENTLKPIKTTIKNQFADDDNDDDDDEKTVLFISFFQYTFHSPWIIIIRF